MNAKITKRDFLKLAGLGGVVFASALPGFGSVSRAAGKAAGDFYFVQLSDLHWGFKGPAINPLDLQAAPSTVENERRMGERCLFDESPRALFLPERRDAADMIAGDALGLGRRQHRGIFRSGRRGELLQADLRVGRHQHADGRTAGFRHQGLEQARRIDAKRRPPACRCARRSDRSRIRCSVKATPALVSATVAGVPWPFSSHLVPRERAPLARHNTHTR